MKKLSLILLAGFFALGLAACNPTDTPLNCETGTHEEDGVCVADEDPLVCETGFHEEDGACVEDVDPLVCETGYHEEDGTCVIDEDPLVCDAGYIIVDGACVIDPNAQTQEEIVAGFIVQAFENTGSMAFLGASMAQMDFSSALRMTFELDIEVTEDIDETHQILATVTDSYVYDDIEGDMVKREISIDLDGELIEFVIILVEVETGVHVYIQPEMIIDAITAGDPSKMEIVGWVGFTNEWAVFEFDDTLENVIEIAVLKEMLVSLIFSEIGEMFFYNFQENELEPEIMFDLNQYGVDIGLLVDKLIEEDFTGVELMLQNIDVEGIILNLDYVFIAHNLHEVLMQFETELLAASFDTTKIAVLDTADWDEFDELIVVDPVVNTMGTQFFFESLTEAEIQILIDVVIEPTIEEMIYHTVGDEFNTDELENDFYWYIENHRYDLENFFGWDVTAELVDLDTMGLLPYYNQLTELQIQNLMDVAWDDWDREIMYEIEDRMYLKDDVIGLLTTHELELEGYGYDVDQWLIDLGTMTLEEWYTALDPTIFEALMDDFVYLLVEEFHQAVLDREVAEFLMDFIFDNPHIDMVLEENPVFDHTIIAGNMMDIDFDALVLEVIDLELLADAIRAGQIEYDLFVAGLTTTAPNMQLFLEVISPAILELEPYMVYVDDIELAFDNLIIFEDYLDLDYYMDNIVDANVSATDEFYILTTMDLDGIAYAQLFSDLSDSVNEYLSGFTTFPFPFDENWVCLPDIPEEECQDVNINEVIAALTQFGDIELYMLYNPSDISWMEIGLDVTDLLDSIAQNEYDDFLDRNPGYVPNAEDDILTGFTNATFTATMDDEAEIVVPEETTVDIVNEIAEDLAKFAVTMEAYDILRDVSEYYQTDPTMLETLYNTQVALETLDFISVSAAFDKEMSYVTISADLVLGVPDLTTLDYEIVLYWIDGTLVFDDTVGIAEFAPLLLDGDLVDEAAYLTIIGKVDETTFHMTKMFLIFMLEDNNDEYNEEYPQ